MAEENKPTDAQLIQYRAALVSIGALYEDYDGPLSDEMTASAKRIIAERQQRAVDPGELG